MLTGRGGCAGGLGSLDKPVVAVHKYISRLCAHIEKHISGD
jgi:hypothetical protein